MRERDGAHGEEENRGFGRFGVGGCGHCSGHGSLQTRTKLVNALFRSYAFPFGNVLARF